MEHACELLLGTDMGIAQIGVQVGYDDPSFFSKAFKKELGLSPLDYRRQNG
jgi:two-component system response regulator YesN